MSNLSVLKPARRRVENPGMRPAAALLLLASIATPALSAETPRKLVRGDDVFRLGMARSELESALVEAGMKVLSQEPEFILCEGRDGRVEYEQYSLHALPHGQGVLWRVTLGFRSDAGPSEFADVEATLRDELGAPADSTDLESGDPFDPAPGRRLRWTDGRTMVVLGARWPEKPKAADRMIVEWSDLKLRRAIGAAANRPRGSGR